MKRVLWRACARLAIALAIALLHAALGRWLAGLDPLAELIDGARVLVALAGLVFVPLRAIVWLLLPVWLAAGTIADLLDARSTRAPP